MASCFDNDYKHSKKWTQLYERQEMEEGEDFEDKKYK